MIRSECLTAALDAVTNDRNAAYGNPEKNFHDIAGLWNIYLRDRFKFDECILPADVAVMMLLLKVSRIKTSPYKEDHWVDIAGYAACGCECVHEMSSENEPF